MPVEVVLLSGTRRLFELVPSLKVSELLIILGDIHKLSLFHELKLIFKGTEIDSKHEVSHYAHQTLHSVRFLSWSKCSDKLEDLLRDARRVMEAHAYLLERPWTSDTMARLVQLEHQLPYFITEYKEIYEQIIEFNVSSTSACLDVLDKTLNAWRRWHIDPWSRLFSLRNHSRKALVAYVDICYCIILDILRVLDGETMLRVEIVSRDVVFLHLPFAAAKRHLVETMMRLGEICDLVVHIDSTSSTLSKWCF